MKSVLVIGSGGREHALAWKLRQSKHVGEIFVAPGNGGTEKIATNVAISAENISELIKFAKKNSVHLTVVGPDNSLALGIVDEFHKTGLRIFGPTKKAAEIEWSKAFAKKLMRKYNIPTAEYEVFSSTDAAKNYLIKSRFPLVVKADGLALGKGVFICHNQDEALNALEIMSRLMKHASSQIVIEEYLEGVEVSAHAICDGSDYQLFPLAQDHKRISEGNTGSNTGGMGTICPVPEPVDEIKGVIGRTLTAMEAEGRPFSGCLFPGLMLTKKGPKVLEFNARFGDPETQVYMRLLKSDLFEVLEAAVEKQLAEISLEWEQGAAICVVLASKGYPNNYQTGYPIMGLNQSDEIIFHAGTKSKDNQMITNGGRILNVTAAGKSLSEVNKKAYEAINNISFEGMQFRKDIGSQYLNKS